MVCVHVCAEIEKCMCCSIWFNHKSKSNKNEIENSISFPIELSMQHLHTSALSGVHRENARRNDLNREEIWMNVTRIIIVNGFHYSIADCIVYSSIDKADDGIQTQTKMNLKLVLRKCSSFQPNTYCLLHISFTWKVLDMRAVSCVILSLGSRQIYHYWWLHVYRSWEVNTDTHRDAFRTYLK